MIGYADSPATITQAPMSMSHAAGCLSLSIAASAPIAAPEIRTVRVSGWFRYFIVLRVVYARGGDRDTCFISVTF